MKRLALSIALLLVMALNPSLAAATTTLERAVLELPSEAVADIPITERRIFLTELRKDTPRDKRLDIKNGYLEFYTDGDVPFHASSMLYMKVFHRTIGGSLVLCHMPKPHADGESARPGQTFIFTRREGQWVDVTGEILPKGSNALWRFQPRRDSAVIEVGPYERTRRRDGLGYACLANRRVVDLIWDGAHFRIGKAKSPDYTDESK